MEDNQSKTDVNEKATASRAMALSAAIAMQDAVDNLRNINTVSSTALGAVIVQMLENPGGTPGHSDTIAQIFNMNAKAMEHFTRISAESIAIIEKCSS